MKHDLIDRVYRMYGREIYLYLYSLSKDHSLAEELPQETFLKAILSLPDSHTNVRAWLYTVARNLFYNTAKRESRKADVLSEEWEQEANNFHTPENTVLDDLQNRTLYEALLTLDSVKREIISLQFFSGMSGREIAALLGLREENVRVLSYRAKKELKKFMEEQGYGLS